MPKNADFSYLSIEGVFIVLELFFISMNARKLVNRQGDREFQALSESIIAFSKTSFYSDEKF